MTYVNNVGRVSVPEDLWGDMLVLLEEFLPEIESSSVSMVTLRRARALDAQHRLMRDIAERRTQEQIEAGGSGRPYDG